MYYKNAIQKLARNIDLVSHPAAIAVISGIFFPHGNVWNAIGGTLLWISMQGSAFFFPCVGRWHARHTALIDNAYFMHNTSRI